MDNTIAGNANIRTAVDCQPGAIQEIVGRLQSLLSRVQDAAGRSEELADRVIGPVPEKSSDVGPGALGAPFAINTVFHIDHMIDEINGALSDVDHQFKRLAKL